VSRKQFFKLFFLIPFGGFILPIRKTIHKTDSVKYTTSETNGTITNIHIENCGTGYHIDESVKHYLL